MPSLVSCLFMNCIKTLWYCCFIIGSVACTQHHNKPEDQTKTEQKQKPNQPEVIIDCYYSFSEAIQGTKAPKSILSELELFTVKYYSFDGKLHQGQILSNKKIATDLKNIFHYIQTEKFPIGKAIPAVRYGWDDDASMNDNNTYSFCYRNVSYSKHATGMAIDINPMQNPVRWNPEYRFKRSDKPIGAVYDTIQPGTFYPTHPVVKKFTELGFFWGRNFRRNNDDHHFEMKKD